MAADWKAQVGTSALRHLPAGEISRTVKSTGTGYRPSVEAQIDLPAEVTSPARARRFALGILAGLDVHELADTMVLLVSEVVTNAVVHARTACTLRILHDERCLRVELHDASIHPAVVSSWDGDRPGGRGMTLVSSLADGWGSDVDGGGKVVWFELALPIASA